MLERSTRFGFGNFAHGVRIRSFPELSILHYSNVLERSTRFDQENLTQSVLERSTRFDQENYFILINHLYENNMLTIIITIIILIIINNF